MKILAAAFGAAFLLAAPAGAHEPYSSFAQLPAADPYTGKTRPGGAPCCGGSDCAPLAIEPGVLEAVEDGYKITLNVAQARRINPYRKTATSFVVPWSQIQPSWDDRFHLCIPNGTDHLAYAEEPKFYCFWAPPDT